MTSYGWNAEHKAEKRAYNQSYYHNHPGNRERILAQRKENYHSNPEVRQYALDWKKRPEVREYNKTYLKTYNKTPTGKSC